MFYYLEQLFKWQRLASLGDIKNVYINVNYAGVTARNPI